MLRSVKDMMGYPVKATDGRIGRVRDCLFEDSSWKMRHLVVDTGSRFHLNFHYLSEEDDFEARRRDVLIEPEDLKSLGLGWIGRKLRVRLTKDKVEHSPSVASDSPVSQQYEREYTNYYRHAPYGSRPHVWDFIGSSSYQPPVSAYPHDQEELEALESSPRFHPHAAVNRDALSRYYDYYGKPLSNAK
jgi:hypothetical protein